MKTRKNISNSIIVLLCCLIFVGCKPKNQTTLPKEVVTEKQQIENAELPSLFDLPSDSKVIPLAHPKSGIISGSGLLIDVETDNLDSVYQLIEDIPDDTDSLNSQAFRIQIFSSKKFGESQHAKVVAEEIFDRPVFLDYEVPYYKIRVGNFATRDKAETYQQRVKSSGYKNAWVVVVIVNVKETTPMYDDDVFPEILDSLNIGDESDENNE